MMNEALYVSFLSLEDTPLSTTYSLIASVLVEFAATCADLPKLFDVQSGLVGGSKGSEQNSSVVEMK